MLHFLGFILIIILAVALIGFAILLRVVRGVFGLGRGRGQEASRTAREGYRAQQTRRTTASVSDDGTVSVEEGELHINRKKIFGKDEGEYVSYEEVKE